MVHFTKIGRWRKMPYYRKKPVIVEAFRWTGGPDQTDDPEWIIEKIREQSVWFYTEERGTFMMINTLEGVMQANQGDYIIKGVNGEIYPCKPDIFEKTYDLVNDFVGPSISSTRLMFAESE